MRKTITILLAIGLVFVLASCQKKFVTSIDLAVDYSDETGGLVLTKNTADTCYIHVTSNMDWKAGLTFPQDEQQWCRLDKKEGHGIDWIPLIYQANESGVERTAVFNIETSSKSIKFTISQPK